MLETFALILLVVWLLAVVANVMFHGWIHLLLLVVAALVLVSLVRPRRKDDGTKERVE